METKVLRLAIDQNSLCINEERIDRRLKKLATFGLNKNGGIDRSFGSSEDVRSREWLKKVWSESLHCQVRVDPIANLWAETEGSEKLRPIVVGSHHDAVANGGKYDGAAGVLLATEVMQTLKEEHDPLRHPMKIVSFSAEEPNPYQLSTLGSRSITGVLQRRELASAVHGQTNEKLTDTVRRLGGDVALLEKSLLQPGDFSVFLECHIEQGRNLADSGCSLGVVTKITGIYREQITIVGEANHSGTTLMPDRHDALLAGAELSLALETIVSDLHRNDVVGTIGQFDVRPDSANIIPGEVALIAEIRTSDKRVLQDIVCRFADRVHAIKEKRGVRIIRKVILDQGSVSMDQTIQCTLGRVIRSMGEPYLRLPSMAGHDAVHMAPVARTGMLFVPSINGKSHCPEEETRLEDLIKAGNVLLQTVIALDKELD